MSPLIPILYYVVGYASLMGVLVYAANQGVGHVRLSDVFWLIPAAMMWPVLLPILLAIHFGDPIIWRGK